MRLFRFCLLLLNQCLFLWLFLIPSDWRYSLTSYTIFYYVAKILNRDLFAIYYPNVFIFIYNDIYNITCASYMFDPFYVCILTNWRGWLKLNKSGERKGLIDGQTNIWGLGNKQVLLNLKYSDFFIIHFFLLVLTPALCLLRTSPARF